MATYGDFPGVRVESEQGGIQSVAVGLAEKVVLFGEPNYAEDDTVDGDGTVSSLTAINSPLEADSLFGAGSELAEAMKTSIQNGANIDFVRGVAVPREDITGEAQGAQTGQLENVEVFENLDTITVEDVDADGNAVSTLDVEFRYKGAPAAPESQSMVYINPLTGDYAADSGATDHYEFSYKHVDYETAFNDRAVTSYVNENETGIFFALSDSDAVSSQLASVVSTLRTNYQMVTGFAFAEPNASTVLDSAEKTAENGGAEPFYNTANYTAANQSVSSNSFFKAAPARKRADPTGTIGGGLAGLYAGKPIDDAVYNEVVGGYSSMQQSLNKTEADDLRDQDLIPVRSAGSVRVKGNRATNFSESGTVAADFWTRRITDRVILIVKQVGDSILGRINNPETRTLAEDVIVNEIGSLAADGIIKPNTDEQNFAVQVYEDSGNSNEVNIDVQFTPYGIVKRVDAGITVNV
jgi:hypothetical protein